MNILLNINYFELTISKTLMSWVKIQFYLNFKRNKIIEIDIVNLDNSWPIFPSAKYMIESIIFYYKIIESIILFSKK